MINFAAFYVVALCIGGDAVGGKVEDGKYYVSSHGKYTEVSESVYRYSRLHTYSVWVTHPIGMLAIIVAIYVENREKKGERSS